MLQMHKWYGNDVQLETSMSLGTKVVLELAEKAEHSCTRA